MEAIIKAGRLFHQQGLSIRQIAKQLNINRRTVTKYIEPETGALLFNLISHLHEQVSLVLTTNLVFTQWARYLAMKP